MAKGMRVKLNYEVSRDPDTGVEVTRLTPPEVTCHRNYFYQKCFFNDGSHLLFAGEFDGNWNYYLLDLKKAEAVQLTEGTGDNTFGGFLSPDDKSFYYVKNDRTLLEVNLHTGRARSLPRL
jgi:oligogalacturonide lyase